MPDVYLVPLALHEQGLDRLVCEQARDRRAGAGPRRTGIELVERIEGRRESIEIALVGKYVKLHDAYLSVHEALKHAGIANGCRVHVRWVDAEDMTLDEARAELAGVDGVLVPGGFGSRGWEGKILACRVAREDEIPYLGICLGMHVAVSEFARHVCGLDGANSTEMDPETPYPVIDLLPEQKEVEDLGGTMRLGAQAVELADGTRTREVYGGEPVISERHRHRYEVNNAYRQQLVERRPRRQRDVPGGAARRDHRAARPPVVRRIAVPPGVQVAADAAGAALPRVRRRRARAVTRARRRARRPVGFSPGAAGGPRSLLRARGVAEPARRGARRRRRGARATSATCGLPVDEDDAGPRVGSTMGNIYARIEPTADGEPLFLCAHLDTVPPTAAIEPVVEDGVVRNAAGTILGGDNKAAVAAMLEGTRRVLAESRPHAGIELLFTPKEEVGLIGAYAFDHARLRARIGYVYDQAAPIGAVILGAPFSQRDRGARSTAAPRTRGCIPRRVARRSPRRRGRSPSCGSGGSTS